MVNGIKSDIDLRLIDIVLVSSVCVMLVVVWNEKVLGNAYPSKFAPSAVRSTTWQSLLPIFLLAARKSSALPVRLAVISIVYTLPLPPSATDVFAVMLSA